MNTEFQPIFIYLAYDLLPYDYSKNFVTGFWSDFVKFANTNFHSD